jgi:hypothetical protein
MIAGMMGSRHFVISRSTLVLRMREPGPGDCLRVLRALLSASTASTSAIATSYTPRNDVAMRRSSTNMEPTARR